MLARDCTFPALDKLPSRPARHAVRWALAQNVECERLEWGNCTLTVINVHRMSGHIARWFFVGERRRICSAPLVLAGFAESNRIALFKGGLRLGGGEGEECL